MRPALRLYSLLLPAMCLALAACGRRPTDANTQPEPPGRLITAEQIERSGANTAWEALQRHGPIFAADKGPGDEPTSMSRRGRSSIYLDESPLVIIDGVRQADVGVLHQVSARSIESIRILSAIDGTARYGTGATSGVIIVTTRH